MNVLADTASGTLDGAGLFQTICTWLTLLAVAFWVGGVVWEAWVLPPGSSADGEMNVATRAAALRFRHFAPYALALLFVADFGAIRFGNFWWLRQIVVGVALVLSLPSMRAGWVKPAHSAKPKGADAVLAPLAVRRGQPSWQGEIGATLRGVGALPDWFVQGWRRLDALGRVEALVAFALLVAYALSANVAGAPASKSGYDVALYLLQLLAEAVWLGGLFYLALVLLPIGPRIVPYQRARLLTLGLPRFGPLAMVAAVVLVAAGALDATLRLTSPQQVLTTPYGRTLFVGFELFLILVAVGGYIGLYLRPRLASELGEESSVGMDEDSTPVRLGASATGAAEDGGATLLMRRGDRLGAATPAKASGTAAGGDEPPLTPRAESLEERIRDWLRRQALLGGALLLCVALLVIFAGSLSPTPASTPITTNATATPFSGQQSVGGLTIQLGITPNISGVNTMTVAVKDSQGKPVSGATVTLAIASTDMDMGVAKPQVQPVASTPGSYSAQATISMAGHWQAAVNVTPPNTSTSVQATFTFSVGFN